MSLARLAWLLLGLVLSGPAQADGLRLLFVPDAAPFSMAGIGGKPAGYAVALCESVARTLRPNDAPTWSESSLAGGLDRLAKAEADLLCGPVTDTLAREATVAFSSPIAMGGVGAILRPGAPPWLLRLLGADDPGVATPRSQLGTLDWPRRVAVLRGGTSAVWLSDLIAAHPGEIAAVEVERYEQAVALLERGEAGAWVGEWAVLAVRARGSAALTGMTLIPKPLAGEPLAIAMRPDPALRRDVQRALVPLLRGADLTRMLMRWFGPAGAGQAPLIKGMTPPLGETP